MRKVFFPFLTILVSAMLLPLKARPMTAVRDADEYVATCRAVYDTAQVNVYYKLRYLHRSLKKERMEEGQTLLMVSERYLRFGDYYRIMADSTNDALAAVKEDSLDEQAKAEHSAFRKKAKFAYAMLTDLESGQTTMQCRVLNRYQSESPAVVLDWNLVPGDTVVNGVQCRKATCRYAGRDFVAWYAESISMPYGPYVFGGLPGLVMEVHDTMGEWAFTNNGIVRGASPREMYLYNEKKIIKTTKSKMFDAYRNESENMANIMIETGRMEWYDNSGNREEKTFPKIPCNMIEKEW